jgi:hypothetical protein
MKTVAALLGHLRALADFSWAVFWELVQVLVQAALSL